MKIYVTKYALTKRGIVEFDTENGDLIEGNGYFCLIYHNRHWNSFNRETEVFTSREAAVAHADTLRTAKLEKLRKQIVRLETLDWSAP